MSTINSPEIAISCRVCGHSASIRTRDLFCLTEDLHQQACGIRGLDHDASIDDVLNLPPFDGDETPEPAPLLPL